ncbi:MAG: bifunctional pyr operon transcriptional regulator/uracil phosphoribosyltransferase PyrR [Gammaproteobacteria bacterium]|nr:bifunctional pyr operon transcriptional regulator/uracil phosphoribosyltransferase PyrR [Gammaproteobacteria bacterium]
MPSNIKVDELINNMTADLKGLVENLAQEPIMVGIHTGGLWIAERLHQKLGLKQPLGAINISFYRDDFTRIGMHPQVNPSKLPFSVDDNHIILVDDVLYTGRTIRAALNEIFDYGRPASVTLAVLVERGGRELPIEASVVGQHVTLGAHEHVKLNGPDVLSLSVIEAPI